MVLHRFYGTDKSVPYGLGIIGESSLMTTLEKMKKNGLILAYEDIVLICKKYKIKELSIFGSSIRDDFHKDSDVDILISYINIRKNTLDDFIGIENDFDQLLKRKSHIVEIEALKNPIRREDILAEREVVYVNR